MRQNARQLFTPGKVASFRPKKGSHQVLPTKPLPPVTILNAVALHGQVPTAALIRTERKLAP